MAELEPLPDLEIHFDDHPPVPEVKVLPVEVHAIPGLDEPQQVPEQNTTGYPKMIMIKKQTKPALWHMPEQDFHIARHVINPNDMDAFDKFIEENIPKDPNVRVTALKFIEDVLLAKTNETESRVFYNDGKNKSFRISFLL